MSLNDRQTAIFDMNEIIVEYKIIKTYLCIYKHVTGSKEYKMTAKYRTESNIFGDNTTTINKNDHKRSFSPKKC